MKFEEGETVNVINLDFVSENCVGEVRGISTISQPMIGVCYIVQILSGEIPNETYPYTCISIPEIFLTRIT